MGKVQEILIGHRTFAVDIDWKRWEEERCNQLRCQKFDAWSEKWITVYQLKNSRLWTDTAIRRWPGVPLQQGKYKVLSVEAVRMAETRPDFQAKLQTRIDKVWFDMNAELQYNVKPSGCLSKVIVVSCDSGEVRFGIKCQSCEWSVHGHDHVIEEYDGLIQLAADKAEGVHLVAKK